MYATIRIYNQPELADELAGHADEIQALMAGVDGLQSYDLFRTDAGCASIAVCEPSRPSRPPPTRPPPGSASAPARSPSPSR